ncbi:MAG: 50S ribosomal protein L4 [Acidobacteriota bacterium]|nr:50S ribosomal protein L4 [Acidobacteriota bacterium]
MKIAVKNLAGETVKEIELPEQVFEYPYKEDLIHTAVVANRAAMRSGTHKTKTRGEVSGSGRKVWRQKGTGRARVGGIRSPLWRTGGTIHGPQPRSYDTKMSRREKRNALKSALSRKLALEGLVVLDGFALDSPKTASLEGKLADLGIEGKALLVSSGENANLALASRNNPRLKVVDALAVNVYDVVDRSHVVTTETALDRLIEVLQG